MESLMNPFATTIAPLEPATAGSHRPINAHRAVLPIIANDGWLLGIVTVDAARLGTPGSGASAPIRYRASDALRAIQLFLR